MSEDQKTVEASAAIKGQVSRVLTESPPTSVGSFSVKMSEPHPTLIFALFRCCLGFTKSDNVDKSTWQFHLRYKGCSFIVEDRKHSSWWISSGECKDEHELEKLAKFIVAMAKKYERKVLAPMWKSDLDHDRYSINNTFSKSWHTYQFFKGQTKEHLSKQQDAVREARSQNVVDVLNDVGQAWAQEMRRKHDVSYFATAMIVFFFAWTESLIDLGFAFSERRTGNYGSFRLKKWKKRFNSIFAIDTDRELQKMYQGLHAVLGEYRHKIAHGLGGVEFALFMIPDVGIVPATYDQRLQNVRALSGNIRGLNSTDPWVLDVKASTEIADLFERFEKYVSEHAYFSCLLRYGLSPLAIPLDHKRCQEIRSKMSDPESFECWIANQELMHEKMINGE